MPTKTPQEHAEEVLEELDNAELEELDNAELEELYEEVLTNVGARLVGLLEDMARAEAKAIEEQENG